MYALKRHGRLSKKEEYGVNKITVKEVLLSAAAEVGLYYKVYAYLEEGEAEGLEATEALLRCFNLVENELALDYLPLYAEEEVVTDTGTVYYSELSRPAVRVVKVEDAWGNDMPFRLFPEYLKTQGGTLKIRYAYVPAKKTVADDSDYHTLASVRLFTYGIAAEYSLSIGLFEEAAVWDKKYKDAVTAAYRSNPCRVIQSRRWV